MAALSVGCQKSEGKTQETDKAAAVTPLLLGALILTLLPALHRDPAVWGDNAAAFDPDHFAPERERSLPAHAYKPFGTGQRACIGRQFALQEAQLALAMILQRFTLIDHHDYQLTLKQTLTIKPDGLLIQVRLRTERRTMIVTAQPAPEPLPEDVPHVISGDAVPLLVLFGSNLGTAEGLAQQITNDGVARGFAATIAPLDDYVDRLPTDGAVVIVSASYNGTPPDNASAFCQWLQGDLSPSALAGVRYTVFGCGNRDWAATYQSVPRLIDEQLKAHGGRSVHDRGEGDAKSDFDGQFEKWFGKLAAAATKEFGLESTFARSADDEPLYSIEPVAPTAVNAVVALGGASAMKVLVNNELQNKSGANPSERSTRHIEVQLPASLSYRVGDHLSVVPRNDPALVDSVARRFGFLPADQIRLQAPEGRRAQLPVGEVISVGRLLTEFVELQQVATRKQIQTMAEHTRCPMTRPKLEALSGEADEAYRAEVLTKRKSVYDLLEEHPACELPLAAYLEMTPLLQPRYYSISSSPKTDPARCTVTVGVVEGPARSGRGTFKGVCSNYLAGRGAEENIFAAVRETKAGFRLPDDAKVPLIMVGPGTGLAPFRGFLQERAAQKKAGAQLGPAMLFFGCRRPDQDFLYADELKGYAADGIVELHTAFSRMDGQPKTYVQDLVRTQQDRVWSLIEAGAIVYICGDGGKMEPDVKRALVEIYCARKNATPEQGEAWINEMGANNRYVLDVWAGG